jgi:hypothetical protein
MNDKIAKRRIKPSRATVLKLLAEAHRLLDRAGELLLDARAKHEAEVERRKKAESDAAD